MASKGKRCIVHIYSYVLVVLVVLDAPANGHGTY